MTKEHYLALVHRTRNGDQQAAQQLFEGLAVRLRVLVKHKLWGWSRDEHNDLIQATLTTFLEKIQEVNENPSAFVMQILNNKIGNEIRTKTSRQSIPIAGDSPSDFEPTASGVPAPFAVVASPDAADAGIESREELERVTRAIDALRPFCRAAFKGILEGKSIGEVWAALRSVEPRLNRSAFDKRLFQCRKELRRMILSPA